MSTYLIWHTLHFWPGCQSQRSSFETRWLDSLHLFYILLLVRSRLLNHPGYLFSHRAQVLNCSRSSAWGFILSRLQKPATVVRHSTELYRFIDFENLALVTCWFWFFHRRAFYSRIYVRSANALETLEAKHSRTSSSWCGRATPRYICSFCIFNTPQPRHIFRLTFSAGPIEILYISPCASWSVGTLQEWRSDSIPEVSGGRRQQFLPKGITKQQGPCRYRQGRIRSTLSSIWTNATPSSRALQVKCSTCSQYTKGDY